MHCPRCGTENQEGDRFCANCGRPLPGTREATREGRSPRETLAAAIGSTRRARLITAATALAIVIAIVAFVALDTGENEQAVDAYTLAADDACVQAKREIQRVAVRALDRGDAQLYASRLVVLVAAWRADLNGLDAPAELREDAAALDDALREIEVASGRLARLAREGGRDAFFEQAAIVDELTLQAEAAIADLELTRCSRIEIRPGAASR